MNFKSLYVALACSATLLVAAQKKTCLFNQKNLKGWYAYQSETGKNEKADAVFSVSDKMIRMYGANAGYLMSNKSYDNFVLSVNFRWNTDTQFVRKSDKKNSGVMYWVPENTSDELWPKGIQYQIKENATGDFVFLQEVTATINGVQNTPGKSVVSKFFKNNEKPAGEWNTLTVTCSEGKITQILNGEIVNEASNASVNKGRILLQYEGYPIDFKNITIQKLKK
ncbi:3-keto-disaccharide hydrolase [Flavobacterium agrisoli]|uniref:DUF1080 domain-containing protein n=1 Tax=Flavobacterium agrisoli TaxID=2793066 RepID=A0A934PNK0_9FLAO|nr:DUF1080 domain-containing protein [Flavobacterium agrisoli]MBK0370069.1 DUF1080 domain-containing protein [Flavobacterium agrisoli]